MDNFLIGDFEGPLDLLLHLVKQSKIEICDLKLVDITNQYVSFLKKMEEMNLDIASEYLVVASELIEMKSRFLLPRVNENEEDNYEENPEEELKRRLTLYEQYKESVPSFRSLEEKRSSYFTKAPERREEFTNQKLENNENVTAYDLLSALEKLLERKEYQKPLKTKIARKELSVSDRVSKIRSIL